ncbi:hypothetical protein SDJN03_22719, partial [Cucurbita argyrosperma subsp. sororia]
MDSTHDILEKLVAAWSRARRGHFSGRAFCFSNLISDFVRLLGCGPIVRSCRARAARCVCGSAPIAESSYWAGRFPAVEVTAITELPKLKLIRKGRERKEERECPYECWKRLEQLAQRKSLAGKPTSPHRQQRGRFKSMA